LFLAQDIVKVLKILGTRAMYTTHLHDLAAMVDTINRDTPGESKLMSMVAQVEKSDEISPTDMDESSHPGDSPGHTPFYTIKPTFKIIPGPPMGQSYAIELASKFGISKDQLLSTLKERGEVLPEE
jgi:hypothetical protein